jgi:hypothetical protein
MCLKKQAYERTAITIIFGKEVLSMFETQERLVELLMEKNGNLTYSQARTWVELLWDDFETTRAKAGYEYKGSQMTDRIVRQWIENYGSRLHDFVASNPKYKDLLDQEQDDKNLH